MLLLQWLALESHTLRVGARLINLGHPHRRVYLHRPLACTVARRRAVIDV